MIVGLVLGWLAATEEEKTQVIRALDVVLLGPFMIYIASQDSVSEITGSVLAFAGAATISYNARNFKANLSESLRGLAQ